MLRGLYIVLLLWAASSVIYAEPPSVIKIKKTKTRILKTCKGVVVLRNTQHPLTTYFCLKVWGRYGTRGYTTECNSYGYIIYIDKVTLSRWSRVIGTKILRAERCKQKDNRDII